MITSIKLANFKIEQLETLVAQQAAVIEQMREAYSKMRNAAAGYSNFCDDSASVRRCERDYEDAEQSYRAIPLQPCPEVLNKVMADAVREAANACAVGVVSQSALCMYAQRIEQG